MLHSIFVFSGIRLQRFWRQLGSMLRRSGRRYPLMKRRAIALLLIFCLAGLGQIGWRLHTAATQPVQAFFVLGGSIRREIYVAQQATQFPNIPILISQGSKAPCVWQIFQREKAPIQQVWLENCAHSTFDNFYYAIPLLRQWQVHHVRMFTSASHLPRAQWLGQILFGAQGIWMDLEVVPETGRPANRESWLKTSLDVVRSLAWALISQVYTPSCSQVSSLQSIDLEAWEAKGFSCEHQGKLKDRRREE